MKPLEARYRRLLTLYPAAYRRERGEEMLATLMEDSAADGRSRPTVKETVGLCLGAVRVRVRANTVDPVGDVLKGVWWGAAMWLVFVTLLSGMHALWSLAILATVALALAGHKLPASIIAVIASAQFVGALQTGNFNGYATFKFAVPLVVVAAIAPRTSGRARLAAYAVIGVAGVAIASNLVPGWYDMSRLGVATIAGVLVVWALTAAVVSGRLLAPLVAASLITAGNTAVSVLYHGGDTYVWLAVAIASVLLARFARKRTATHHQPPIRASHT